MARLTARLNQYISFQVESGIIMVANVELTVPLSQKIAINLSESNIIDSGYNYGEQFDIVYNKHPRGLYTAEGRYINGFTTNYFFNSPDGTTNAGIVIPTFQPSTGVLTPTRQPAPSIQPSQSKLSSLGSHCPRRRMAEAMSSLAQLRSAR